MSRLNDLLRELRARDPALARDLEREVTALADRRAFGLNFERHVPEAVELPGRKVRKGDKVRVLPPRGETPKADNDKLWRVVVDRPLVGNADGLARSTVACGRRLRPRDGDRGPRRPRRRRRVPRPDLPRAGLDGQGRTRRRQAVPHGHQRRELPRARDAAVHASRQGRLRSTSTRRTTRARRTGSTTTTTSRATTSTATRSGSRSWSVGCSWPRSC